uniref:GLTP domain-containing protein n=1 Tax=Parastrongyloides trichosuri TaxID=131310 RepID=A0A0N4ZMA0_PARTI
MAEEDKIFNLSTVTKNFTDSLMEDNEDVCLAAYINAYKELNKVFRLLGRIFSFVESDVVNKLEILSTCLKNKPDSYVTVKTMLEYECFNQEKPLDQGSRTLLRLHRALNFIILFVNGLIESHYEGTPMSTIVKDVYDKTLAEYHGFFIRKSVGLAVYTLPTTDEILRGFFGIPEGEKIPTKKIHNEAQDFHGASHMVYYRVQQAYLRENLLDLP